MDEKQAKRFQFWCNSSREEIDVAHTLIIDKKLRQALFFIHLSLEKLFKALYIKDKGEHPPLTHNLLFLAEQITLELTEEQKIFLSRRLHLISNQDTRMKKARYLKLIMFNRNIRKPGRYYYGYKRNQNNS